MQKGATRSKPSKPGDINVRFWNGSVGVCLTPLKKRDGNYFWSYEPLRFFKAPDGTSRYSNRFTDKHDKQLAEVLSEAFRFRDETDATEHVAKIMAELEQKEAA